MIDKINELNEMRKTCKKEMNKEVNHYPCCFSDYREKGRETRNKRHNNRMKKERTDTITKSENTNRKYIKDISNYKMSTGHINPLIEEKRIKQQRLQDFKQFAR